MLSRAGTAVNMTAKPPTQTDKIAKMRLSAFEIPFEMRSLGEVAHSLGGAKQGRRHDHALFRQCNRIG